VIVLGLVLLLLIVAIDYALGYSLRLTVVYVVPIMILAWGAGRGYGILLSLVACLSWGIIDYRADRFAGHDGYLYLEWGLVLLALLALVAGLSGLKVTLAEANFASRRDVLTGLVNKGGFYQVVNAEMEVCRRYRRTLSIAYIDCDNFKAVNDRFGHHVGDEVLRAVARTMSRKLRSSDLAARLGGDEFAVMLPETNAESCRMVVEMMQQRLLAEMEAHTWPVGFSIGIATFLRMPPSIDDMIRLADQLMYSVKHSRKGEIRQEVYGSAAPAKA
jgi:diguanylate cyclase (GGDEF)-like protein